MSEPTALNFCPTCGTQRITGQRYCANCGLDYLKQAQIPGETSQPSIQPPGPPSAMQGLAQASHEVQNFNALLIVGRLVGVAVGMAILWFVVGPAFGEENPLAVIIAFFVLFLGGLLAGQYVTIQLLRR